MEKTENIRRSKFENDEERNGKTTESKGKWRERGGKGRWKISSEKIW